MTPEEKKEFVQFGNDLSEIKREVLGTERFDYTDGMAFRMRRLEEGMRELQQANKKMKAILTGIAYGLAIGAVIFGYITVKELIGFVK